LLVIFDLGLQLSDLLGNADALFLHDPGGHTRLFGRLLYLKILEPLFETGSGNLVLLFVLDPFTLSSLSVCQYST
jgi:hypothetical protein